MQAGPSHTFVALVLLACAAGAVYRLTQSAAEGAPVELKVQELVRVRGGALVLVLVEKNGERRLPVPLGGAEAAMVERGLRGPSGLEPSALQALGGRVLRASIDEVDGERRVHGHLVVGSGSRELRVEGPAGEAIAIALAAGAPIVIEGDLLAQAGIAPGDLLGTRARGVRRESAAAPVLHI